MLCKDIIKIIEQDYSPRYALSWDNVGLLAGRDDKEVAKIYVALDATDEVVDEAILAGADMLVTHHPLIFSGMKQVNNQNFIGRRLVKLIQHDISYYAMHTNYDVKGMADLAADYLNLRIARYWMSPEKMNRENRKVLAVSERYHLLLIMMNREMKFHWQIIVKKSRKHLPLIQ